MRIHTLAGAATLLVAMCSVASAQTFKQGAPEQHLPPQITQLTGFGERAVWSPDGKRIAFMSKSFGDAFEIDLNTRLTKLLTGHFRHAGFLRVHYLPNGDYLLIGARDFKDIRTTRDRDEEFWVMKAAWTAVLVAATCEWIGLARVTGILGSRGLRSTPLLEMTRFWNAR